MKTKRKSIIVPVICLILLSVNIPAFGLEENEALTLEEAVQLAIANSGDLKDLELNIQKAKINLDRQKKIADTPGREKKL